MATDPSSPDTSDSFQVLFAALRHGDNDAWREVLCRYSARLIALARSRLFDPRLRQKLDPEDVVQSVWRTFDRRHRLGAFQVESWDGLWGLLLTLTVYRVCKWVQHYNTQKRSLGREVPLACSTPADEKEAPAPAAELADSTPTPAEVVLLQETVNERLAALGPSQRQIIELGLAGSEDAEIGSQVGRTEARVRQVRADFVQELLGLVDGAAANP